MPGTVPVPSESTEQHDSTPATRRPAGLIRLIASEVVYRSMIYKLSAEGGQQSQGLVTAASARSEHPGGKPGTPAPSRLTFHAVLHLLQVAQRYPHEAGVQHQLVAVCRPHVLRGRVDEENPRVPSRDLVVAD